MGRMKRTTQKGRSCTGEIDGGEYILEVPFWDCLHCSPFGVEDWHHTAYNKHAIKGSGAFTE